MKRFRCLICENEKGMPGRDFQAESPICPNCGLDPSTDPRDAGYIAELVDVHFDPPFHARRGCGHAACDKALTLGKVRSLTGEPAVVTCEACRKTPEWAKAMGIMGVPEVAPEANVAVEAAEGKLEYELVPPATA